MGTVLIPSASILKHFFQGLGVQHSIAPLLKLSKTGRFHGHCCFTYQGTANTAPLHYGTYRMFLPCKLAHATSAAILDFSNVALNSSVCDSPAANRSGELGLMATAASRTKARPRPRHRPAGVWAHSPAGCGPCPHRPGCGARRRRGSRGKLVVHWH